MRLGVGSQDEPDPSWSLQDFCDEIVFGEGAARARSQAISDELDGHLPRRLTDSVSRSAGELKNHGRDTLEMHEIHLDPEFAGGLPADGQYTARWVPLELVAQLLAIDGLEKIQGHLDAVFRYLRSLCQRVDLCSLGQRLTVGSEDIGQVTYGELVRLVHGSQLELTPEVGDDGV